LSGKRVLNRNRGACCCCCCVLCVHLYSVTLQKGKPPSGKHSTSTQSGWHRGGRWRQSRNSATTIYKPRYPDNRSPAQPRRRRTAALNRWRQEAASPDRSIVSQSLSYAYDTRSQSMLTASKVCQLLSRGLSGGNPPDREHGKKVTARKLAHEIARFLGGFVDSPGKTTTS
jgi:hypothetical protein